MKKLISLIATLLILALAIWIGRLLWIHYMDTPWTRDGRVRADVINVAADVTGVVVDVPVKDNQPVKKGDLLMQIDPEHYQLAVKQAEAMVASRKATWEMRKVNASRRKDMDALVISAENREDASNVANSAQADYQLALAQLEAAQLNLQRTKVLAAVDGYVTNLNVHRGDYARIGEAKMAVVDKNSFWVYGFFEETKLPHVKIGDPADMQLMSGEVMKGHVESIARAIYDRDNPESRELIADVNPTFNWVRLAQRVPVRIHLDNVPDGVVLAAGITCTVIVNSKFTGRRRFVLRSLGPRPNPFTQWKPRRLLVDQLLGLVSGVFRETRLNRPRLHLHHPHTKWRQLHAQCIAQRVHGGFRGAISTRKWSHQNTGHTADIHHQTFGPAQYRKQRTGYADNRKHVGFELALHRRYTAVEQRPHCAVSGVVDQHIEAASLLVDPLAKLFQRSAVIDIELNGGEPGRCEHRHIFGLARSRPDFETRAFERIGEGAADAAGTTGNQRNGHGAFLVQKEGEWISRRNCPASVRRENPGFAGDNRGAVAAMANSLPNCHRPCNSPGPR
jgi:RND family efflux transporter MFP subunit